MISRRVPQTAEQRWRLADAAVTRIVCRSFQIPPDGGKNHQKALAGQQLGRSTFTVLSGVKIFKQPLHCLIPHLWAESLIRALLHLHYSTHTRPCTPYVLIASRTAALQDCPGLPYSAPNLLISFKDQTKSL